MYGHDPKNAGGYVIISDPDAPNGTIEIDTRMCCHCGRHYNVDARTKGKLLEKWNDPPEGWCIKCHGYTCGEKKCHSCLALEKRLDLYEKGKLLILV